MSPERFRRARERLGWTQDELAAKAKVSRSIVQSLERPEAARKPGQRIPSQRKAIQVARVLSLDWDSPEMVAPSYPIFGRVAASGWVEPFPEHEIRNWSFPGVQREGAFVLEIMGNSMAPKYQPGDLVLLVPAWETSELQVGDDIYVQCDGNEHEGRATFKTVAGIEDDMTLVLSPRNPEFHPLRVKCGNASRVARAVDLWRKVGR